MKVKIEATCFGWLGVVCVLAACLSLTPPALAAESAQAAAGRSWERLPEASQAMRAGEPWIRPASFQAARIDLPQLIAELAGAPQEGGRETLELTVPMPDGTLARFAVVESPIMEPALAAKFPEIRTYVGQGIDDPLATIRADVTPAGFHAQILSPAGAVYIDPYNKRDVTNYASYYKKDFPRGKGNLECLIRDDQQQLPAANLRSAAVATGETLRSYRLALAATGEYTQFHGGTVSAGMAAIVTAMNRVNGIYETEVAVRMVLVANNDLLVYTNSSSDPYTNGDAFAMLDENQDNIDAVIGSANYDIGHVFSVGAGGVAGLGVVCSSSSKAAGVTGTNSPTGDPFLVDFVAHEMGHQYGGRHTFNGQNGSCAGGNRTGSAAYEPGSGSTIMAYAGICGPNDDLQSNSDAYFHSESFRELTNFTTADFGNTCASTSATGNLPPTVDAGLDYTIPALTPFILTAASGDDPDGDDITYMWEQRDRGPAQSALGMVDNGASPLFRVFVPSLDPSRTFPRISDILNNVTTIGEVLPSTSRFLNFRVTVRDNRAGGGGVAFDDMRITVDGTIGPFAITSPNEPANLVDGVEVTWDVADTDQSPIDAFEVNILLSTDGGVSFPFLLAANTPNDGQEFVSFPDVTTTAARIKVEAVGNIFFDISDANFVIDTFATPLPADPPHDVRKNRFLSFNPNNVASQVAIRLKLLDLKCVASGQRCLDDTECRTCVAGSNPGDSCVSAFDCNGGGTCEVSGESCEPASAPVVLGWIGEPRDPSCQNINTGEPLQGDPPCDGLDAVSRVVPDPVFRVWSETVVHIGDCEIAPVQVYRLEATQDDVVFTSGLDLATIKKPGFRSWGDLVAGFSGTEWFPPEGLVNVNDVQALLIFLVGGNAPHITQVDLGSETPNYIVNATDLQFVLAAFRGDAYPPVAFANQGDPSGCP